MNQHVPKYDTNRMMTVGEVSKRSGIPISTIHFYEEKGLIKSTRNSSNHRRFPSYVLRYIAIIKIAQLTGISLEDIKQSIGEFPTDHKLTKEGWEKISTQWKADLDRRITYLTRLRDELNDCIGCGCLSMDRCPLRNPNDILGEEGAGARILTRPLDEDI
ncbi:redox-sensitive transcriptional activator SoxR [Wohlfahrtiimonas larvae]|uniref:Redox-sensitive transcriptional activator SoxR n=1 Tax=Wohlfahrtiimonas larvae TaxID=1157986 RepID=A0ABP9MUD0_9GAMM|nr:redox-sensitive transcriptional activator SoxR [Wohlfahrtiimonas larvae]